MNSILQLALNVHGTCHDTRHTCLQKQRIESYQNIANEIENDLMAYVACDGSNSQLYGLLSDGYVNVFGYRHRCLFVRTGCEGDMHVTHFRAVE